MSALTDNLNTPEKAGDNPVAKLTVLASEICYAGGIAAVDVNGEVQAAADTAGLKVVGIFTKKVDNTVDGHTAEVKNGHFRFANSSTYPITDSARGTVCYVEDDQTVAGYSTNLVPAGIVDNVDSDGVWVNMSSLAIAEARRLRNNQQVDKTDNYTCTAAIAYEGRTFFSCNKSGGMEITLPSAVAGMRVGVKRAAATATNDLSVQAAAGDTVEGYDGDSAAAKQIDNTVDAISGILWLVAVDATHWKIDRTDMPLDIASWVINNA